MNSPDLNPIAVITIIAGTFFSTPIASIVGPYVIILIAAMGGAAVALLKAETRTRKLALLSFTLSVVFSLLFTVPASLWMQTYFTYLQEHWLFAPVSFIIAYSGDKIPALLSWFAARAGALIDFAIQLRTGQGPKP